MFGAAGMRRHTGLTNSSASFMPPALSMNCASCDTSRPSTIMPPLWTGFIMPVSIPCRFNAPARPPASTDLPTSVSVPVMNTPLVLSRAISPTRYIYNQSSSIYNQFHFIIPLFLIASNTLNASFRSIPRWFAIMVVLSRHLPGGTVGGRMPVTNTPCSKR